MDVGRCHWRRGGGFGGGGIATNGRSGRTDEASEEVKHSAPACEIR